MKRLILSILLFSGVALAQETRTAAISSLMGLGMAAELAVEVGGLATGLGVIPNNSYLYVRNAANSANLGIIKSDASNNTVFNVPVTETFSFSFADNPRLLMAYETDGGHPNVEIYAATEDGADNQFLLIGAGGGPANFNGTRGAMLELSGNEGVASPGRAQIFTGAVPTGYLVLDVMHADGLLIKQSVSATVQTEKLSTGENVTYQNISWAPNSGTKTYSFLSGMYVDTGAAKLELPNGTTIPATCTVGEIFQDTNSNDCADSGGGDGALCICKSTNTWALISNF